MITVVIMIIEIDTVCIASLFELSTLSSLYIYILLPVINDSKSN